MSPGAPLAPGVPGVPFDPGWPIFPEGPGDPAGPGCPTQKSLIFRIKCGSQSDVCWLSVRCVGCQSDVLVVSQMCQSAVRHIRLLMISQTKRF